MTRATRDQRQLLDIEEDIFLGECMVGRIAALAATSSARGRTEQAREARRMLTLAGELLGPLYAVRGRLREAQAGWR